MTTIEEMVETFCELHFADSNSSEPWSAFAKRCPGLAISHREDAKRGLLAVIEKHIGPMVVDACAVAAERFATHPQPGPLSTEVREWCETVHVPNILSALTATGRE